MNKSEIEQLKFDLMNQSWTEELHLGLKEIDEKDAKTIVEMMDDEDINYKVNARRYQEDYIADYLEFLWEISETSFWKHVKATFEKEAGVLWSDNMFYFEILCSKNIPSDVLSKIICYISTCDVELESDINLIGCVIKEQVNNFEKLPEINNIISLLSDKEAYETRKIISEMMNSDCHYL